MLEITRQPNLLDFCPTRPTSPQAAPDGCGTECTQQTITAAAQQTPTAAAQQTPPQAAPNGCGTESTQPTPAITQQTPTAATQQTLTAATQQTPPQAAPNGCNTETTQQTPPDPVPEPTPPDPEPTLPHHALPTFRDPTEAGLHLYDHDFLTAFMNLEPERNNAYEKADELSVARLFGDTLAKSARYNETARCWYVYNGVVWEEDPEGIRIAQYAKRFAVMLDLYVNTLTVETPYVGVCVQLKSYERRKRLIADARDVHPFRADMTDADPYLFNCPNGVLHLDTGELTPHDPDLLLTRCSAAEYDPHASPDLFERFLMEIMSGDADKANCLKTALGYSLLGTAPLHTCFVLYGATTRNGKSTLTETIRALFGTYGDTIEPQTLARRNEVNSAARGDLAKLRGVRFLQMSEPPKNMHLDEAMLKKLTGGDTIAARHLYQREHEFTPVCKLFINTNYLPGVSDNTLFASGRMRVIPFERHFAPEEQDRALPQKLREPQCLSGILNSLLEGLAAYIALGCQLPAPRSVREATLQYAEDSDRLRRFFSECMLRDPNAAVPMRSAYNAYHLWCRESGYAAENKTNFIAELRNRGLVTDKTIKYQGKSIHNAIRGFKLMTDSF